MDVNGGLGSFALVRDHLVSCTATAINDPHTPRPMLSSVTMVTVRQGGTRLYEKTYYST